MGELKQYHLPQHAQVNNNVVEEANLKGNELLVYAFICLKMDFTLKTLDGWSYEMIGSKLGLSVDAVFRAFKKLLDLKVIIKVRNGQKGITSKYRIMKYQGDFEMFSDEFILSKELTNKQKQFLILSQLAADKKDYIVQSNSLNETAKILKMDRRNVKKELNNMEENNLITQLDEASVKLNIDNYGQGFLRNLDRRVSYTETEIKKINKKAKKAESRIEKLEREIAELKAQARANKGTFICD